MDFSFLKRQQLSSPIRSTDTAKDAIPITTIPTTLQIKPSLPEINLLDHQISMARGSTMALETTQPRLRESKTQPEMSISELKAERIQAQPSQLKSQKYHPIPSHLLLRIAQVLDVYERAETNQAEYTKLSSRHQKCLLWNRCLVDLDPKHPFLYQTPRNIQKVAYALDVTETAEPAAFSRQRSKLDRMNPGTTPQKATIGGLGAVVDIDTWETAGDINSSYQRGDYLQCCGDSQIRVGLSDLQSPTEALTSTTQGRAESIASRCSVEPQMIFQAAPHQMLLHLSGVCIRPGQSNWGLHANSTSDQKGTRDGLQDRINKLKTSLLRLGILIDLDSAQEAHGFAMSYFYLSMGGHGVGWPMGRLLTSPSRTHLLYNVLATYRSHNTTCSD
ncbi:hypothetical protein PCH_Pc22g25870 [Penicillium rubens Wisconsin 54-1255]|uniref:Uncharacterized protein n=1 Tax=Penicillium rubens (strain ATCC 28089 / DSM 1075 / NRRL 1951 / Wisconsin 54-1255) TaxID=500485 RepID=B6HSZ9_PENRW|nr:hypothetical protein PCH_Pc22g25870 [Penicillium rubens Wisconsin 54-1255]